MPPHAYQRAFDRSPVGLCFLTSELRVVAANPAMEQMLGYSAKRIRTLRIPDLAHPRDRALHDGLRDDVLAGRRTSYSVDQRVFTAEGRRLWVNVTVGALLDPRAGDAVFISQFSDITGRVAAVEHAHWQAGHDALTGLANRLLLRDRLRQALSRVQRHPAGLAVLFIDLDGFKGVNDRYGHQSGDAVLTTMARRLLHAVRAGDTAARLGGDEFVTVLDGVGGAADAVAVAERVKEVLARPITLCSPDSGTVSITLTPSIGVSVCAGPLSTSLDGDDLLRAADVAMYRAKERGGDHVVLATDALAWPGTSR